MELFLLRRMQDSTQKRVRSLIDHSATLLRELHKPDPDRGWLLSVAWIRYHADKILREEEVKTLTVGGVKVLTVGGVKVKV